MRKFWIIWKYVVSLGKARLPERNVALQKPAKQSTIYAHAYASRAVDGNAAPHSSPSCTHYAGAGNWWAVDLGERFLIQKVIAMTDHNVASGTLSSTL